MIKRSKYIFIVAAILSLLILTILVSDTSNLNMNLITVLGSISIIGVFGSAICVLYEVNKKIK